MMPKIIKFILLIFILDSGDANWRDKLKEEIFPPIKSFYGRGEFMARIHASVQRSKLQLTSLKNPTEPHHHLKYVTGPTEIGKTDTVRKYIEKYGRNFDHFVWLDGSNGKNSLIKSYLGLAHEDDLKNLKSMKIEPADPLFQRIVHNVYTNLTGWTLIIIDHAPLRINGPAQDQETENCIPHFLPPQLPLQPIILVNGLKYDGDWSRVCHDVEVFDLEGYSPNEQIGFVLPNIGMSDYDMRDENARRDAKEIGELMLTMPLPLHLAAAYIKESGLTIQEYVRMYTKQAEQFQYCSKDNPTCSTESPPSWMAWTAIASELEVSHEGIYSLEIMDVLSILQQCDRPIAQNLVYGLTSFEDSHPDDDRWNYFVNSLSLLDKFGAISTTKIDDQDGQGQDALRCEKHLTNVIVEEMKWIQKQELNLAVVQRATKFLTGIVNMTQNPLVHWNSLRTLEKFVNKMDGDSTERERGNIQIPIMELKMKVALAHEKMGEGVKVKLMMNDWFEKVGGIGEKDQAEIENLVMGVLDELDQLEKDEGKGDMGEEEIKTPGMKLRDTGHHYGDSQDEGQSTQENITKVEEVKPTPRMGEVVGSFKRKMRKSAVGVLGDTHALTILLLTHIKK